MKAFSTLAFFLLSFTGFSQQQTPDYKSVHDFTHPQFVTREVIITGDKNPLLQVPALEKPFISILLTGIKTQAIKAYSADNDTLALTPEDVNELLKTDTVNGFATFIPDSVTKLIIKEEWVFQQDKGRLTVHIRGIAPLMKQRDKAGVTHEMPAFWLHYSDIRTFLATQKVTSDKKKDKPENLRDVIEGRYFSSENVHTFVSPVK